MPPARSPARASKSPARETVAAKKSPAKSAAKSPAKSPAKARRSKSPARAKVAETKAEELEEEEEVMEVGDEAAGAAAALAADPVPNTAKASPKAAAAVPVAEDAPAPAPATANIVFVLSALAVVLALLWAVLVPPGEGVGKPKVRSARATFLGPKAFVGTTLRMSGGFRGSALVSFTDKSCPACYEVTASFNALAAQLHPGDSPLAGQLRLAQVDCAKNSPLCTEFGVSGDEAPASGYPTVLWFRDGQLQVSAPAPPGSALDWSFVGLVTLGSFVG